MTVSTATRTLRGVGLLLAFIIPACDRAPFHPFQVSSPQLNFTAAEGGADPADQTVVLSNTGDPRAGDVAWSTSADQPWLTVTPSSGVLSRGQSVTLTVHVNARYQVEGWVRATSTVNAPSVRRLHSQVWTGSRMVVWGGSPNPGTPLNTGALYDPATDTWTGPTSTISAPTARHFPSGIWTGTRMIVWGGWSPATSYVDTGGFYAPDSWLGPTSTVGTPGAREAHTAVWTGDRMIVWGGYIGPELATGGIYDPSTDTWTGATTLTGAPSARQEHSAAWTGSRMIIWGGRGGGPAPFGGSHGDGAYYDPSTDTWTGTMSTVNALTPRMQASAVWTGREVIFWGGFDQDTGNVYFADGKRFDPVTNTWLKSLPTAGAPSARMRHRAVWTGTQMVVWGGEDGGGPLDTGGVYQPPIPSIGPNPSLITISPPIGEPTDLNIALTVTP